MVTKKDLGTISGRLNAGRGGGDPVCLHFRHCWDVLCAATSAEERKLHYNTKKTENKKTNGVEANQKQTKL